MVIHYSHRPGIVDTFAKARQLRFSQKIMLIVLRQTALSDIQKELQNAPRIRIIPTGPKVRGFDPGRGRWIFKGDKNP